MPNNSNELKEVLVTPKELTENQATASYSGVRRLNPPGQRLIRSGAATRRFESTLANPVVKLGKSILISGTFWSEFGFQSSNNIKSDPNFEAVDELVITSIEKSLNNLEYESFENTLKATLDNGSSYGFAVNEFIWESVDGEWLIESIKTKPPFDFDINVDENDDLQSLFHIPTAQNLNPDKFIIAPYPLLRNANYYGCSDTETIEHDVELLEELEKSYAIGSSSVLNKTLLHYFDPIGKGNADDSNSKIAAEKKSVEDAAESGGGIIHFPAIVDEVSGQMKRANELVSMDDRASEHALENVGLQINEYIKRIMRNYGVGDSLGQSTVPVGSFAKSKTEFNMFLAKIQTTQDWIENIVNRQIIPKIMQYNFDNLPDGYKIPVFKFQEVEEDVLQTLAVIVKELKEGGIMTVEEARDKIGLPSIDPSELPQPAEPSEEQQEGILNRLINKLRRKKNA